jgi:hypothetical protein
LYKFLKLIPRIQKKIFIMKYARMTRNLSPTKEELEKKRKAAEGWLSTGLKAGIAVGVVVAVTAFAMEACWGRKGGLQKKKRATGAVGTRNRQVASVPAASHPNGAPPPYSKT